jgi:hypothetical protein
MERFSVRNDSVAIDPGCVKTQRGIIAPGILGSVVMRRAKKRKNLSSARHYDPNQISFSHNQDPYLHAPHFGTGRTRSGQPFDPF